MFRDDDRNLFETGEETQGGHIIRVAFESGADNEFDYLVPDKFWPVAVGQRIEAPFGRSNKRRNGVLRKDGYFTGKIFRGQEEHKLKKITDVIDKEPLLDAQLMELAQWIRDYYVCPLGQVLAAMVPAAVKKGVGEKTEKLIYLQTE